MIDENANDFIDKLLYEDHYVLFDNKKYFLMVVKQKKIVPERLKVLDWKYMI